MWIVQLAGIVPLTKAKMRRPSVVFCHSGQVAEGRAYPTRNREEPMTAPYPVELNRLTTTICKFREWTRIYRRPEESVKAPPGQPFGFLTASGGDRNGQDSLSSGDR